MSAAARAVFAAGCALAATGTGLGALGAHALAKTLEPARLVAYETAVRYQLLHAIALVAVAVGVETLPGRRRALVGAWLVAGGVVLFSGSIYGLVLAGWRWLGPVTPVGGLLLIAGWCVLGSSAIGSRASRTDSP